MRRSRRSPSCNPPPRLVTALLPSSLNLSLGLKISAKTDPIPRPARKKVIAEAKSYSFFMRRTFLPRSRKKKRGPLLRLQEPCQFIETLCFPVDASLGGIPSAKFRLLHSPKVTARTHRANTRHARDTTAERAKGARRAPRAAGGRGVSIWRLTLRNEPESRPG
jgi:hypothetical protein